MEIINAIESWSYPIIELILLIYCLTKLRNRGGEFLAIGFGILIILSLSWRSVNIFHLQLKYEKIYEVLQHINFFMHLIYAGFFIVGISKISSLSNIQKERSMQENLGKMSISQILFSFTGRIGRGTFWGVWFSMMAVGLIVGLIIGGISSSGDEGAAVAIVIYLLFLIPCVWIGLAMQVKRWHDRDKSGWMVLINFIPIIGMIWALVALGFLQGTIGPNQYGEDPLQSREKNSEAVMP